jgi:S-adenosylmethionine decarboxylase
MIVEMKECDPSLLDDVDKIRDVFVSAAKKAKATIVKEVFHRFSPYGVSGVVVIAESHLSIHTWPEYRYAAIDVFTCNSLLDSNFIVDYIIEQLKCKSPSIMDISRGVFTKIEKEALVTTWMKE